MQQRSRTRSWRPNPASVLTALACLAIAGPAQAAESLELHALLIGVGYTTPDASEDLPPLPRTSTDVERLRETLDSRCQYRQVQQMAEDKNDDLAPTRVNMVRRIQDFLSALTPADSALVYFSGHGIRSDDGVLYLAPSDFDPDQPDRTGVTVTWLREQLSGCQAAVKFLVLDACHAGTRDRFRATENLGAAFDKVAGVVTLASSSEQQLSMVDPALGQSLFSYWLTQGIKCHADSNTDGRVTSAELFDFVRAHVEASALRSGNPQTPRMHRGLEIAGEPVMARLTPQPLDKVIDEMAEQIAWHAKGQNYNFVACLPEFTNELWQDSRPVASLGDEQGAFGQRIAQQLQLKLKEKIAGWRIGPQVLSPFEVKSLMDRSTRQPQTPVQLMAAPQEYAYLRGEVKGRLDDVVMLQTRVLRDGFDQFVVRGRAIISDNDLLEQGKSLWVSDEDWRPGRDPRTGAEMTPEKSAIRRWDTRLASKGREHPLSQLDRGFPYDVRIMARRNGTREEHRRPVFHNGEAFVELNKGESYAIEVHYGDFRRLNHGQDVHFKVLVDGVSILDTRFDDDTAGPADNGDRPIFKGIELVRVARR
ncbi:MAG: caspase family protein, partial [Planctomycetales bacterium]|nr:caspase family protein [Planctomycetales bacterium]